MKKTTILATVAAITLCCGSAVAKPLKIFILAGQSNMQGHINVSTFDSMAGDPKTAPILKEMRNADGTPRVCKKVWISSIGCADDDTTEQKGKVTAGFGASTEEIGPEFTFGIYIEKLLHIPIENEWRFRSKPNGHSDRKRMAIPIESEWSFRSKANGHSDSIRTVATNGSDKR